MPLKQQRFAAAIVAATLAGLSPLAAQTAASGSDVASSPPLPVFSDPTNAALMYQRAWLLEAYGPLKQACKDQFKGDDPLWTPDAALSRQLVEHADVVDMLLRASRVRHVDFGIEFSQGVMAVLPHLAEMRFTSRILACDARRCMSSGDVVGACERVAAIFRVSQHCTHDQVLISALVAVAINSIGASQAEFLMNSARMTVAGKDILLPAVRGFDPVDPFAVRRGVEAERRWSTVALRKMAKGPDAGAVLAREMLPLMDVKPDSDTGKLVSSMDEQQANVEFDLAEKYYDALVEAWNSPDGEERIRALQRRLDASEFGTIAKFVVPALGKAFRADRKAQAEHAALVSKLEAYVPLYK